MTTGASIVLIALGAILTFAVDTTVSGIDIDTIGIILMAVGVLGLVLSLAFSSGLSPYRRARVVEERPVLREERTVPREDRF